MSFVRRIKADAKDITHYIDKDVGIDNKKVLYTIQNNEIYKEKLFLNIGFDFDDLLINSAKTKSELAKKIYNVDIPPILYKKEIIQGENFFVKREEDKTTFNNITDIDKRINKMNEENEKRRRFINDLFYEGEENKTPLYFFEQNENSLHILEQLLIDGHTINIISSRREKATEYMRKYFIDNEVFNKYLFPREKYEVPDLVQLKVFGTAEHIKNEHLENKHLDVFFDNTRTKFVHNLIKNYDEQKYKLYLYEPEYDLHALTPEQIEILNKEKYQDIFKLQPIEKNKVKIVKSMDDIYKNITAYANYSQRKHTFNRILSIGHKKLIEDNMNDLL